MALSKNGRFVANATQAEALAIWDVISNERVASFDIKSSALFVVVFNDTAQWIAVVTKTGAVSVWDLSSKQLLGEKVFAADERGNVYIDFVSPEILHIWGLEGDSQNDERYWNIKTGEMKKAYDDGTEFSSERHFKAMIGDRAVEFVSVEDGFSEKDLATGEVLRTLQTGSEYVDTVVYDSKRNRVYISFSKEALVYNYADFSLIRRIPFPSEGSRISKLSKGGDWIVISEVGRETALATPHRWRIVNADTWKDVITLEPDIHESEISLSPSGRFALTAGGNNDDEGEQLNTPTLSVWDLRTGKEMRRFESDTNLYHPFFSEDERYIYAFSTPDGAATLPDWIWRHFAKRDDLMKHAMQFAPRCLTQDERNRHGLSEKSFAWCQRYGKWTGEKPVRKDR
ncbi:MAG: WD40 repeat domain-containing protein [Alphaproteobacteria bacterium]|nr:WD40 repeat domain-containing protein [Alphaproteobacteria bacterium]